MKKRTIDFLKRLVIISIPIILQQLFLNFASLLDTLMVGQLDDASISGVYVATQIIFVANLMIFGSVEGGTVFFSQFFGKRDIDHMRNSYAIKFVFSISIAILETIVLSFFGRNLITLFLDTEAEIQVALDYLNIVLWTMVPFAISVSISSTMREAHHSISPMVITFIGIIFNIVFNYIYIFGKFGAPNLGASGAAIGTMVNRIVEAVLLVGIVIIKKYPFSQNFLHSFKIEKKLFKDMSIKSLPLFLNETLWSLSQTVLVFFFTKCDSIATVVLPIVQTIFNLLFVVLLGLGNGISIVVGNTIGEGSFDEAQKQAYDSLIFTTVSCLVLGILLFIFSDLIVSLYSGVNQDARELASFFIKFSAAYLLINGINTTLFFLLRAGGKTEVVFFFDSFYGWIISIPFAFVLAYFTKIELRYMYLVVYLIDIIKTAVGFILLLRKKWYKNLTLGVSKEINSHEN